jgi:hypothetical protein
MASSNSSTPTYNILFTIPWTASNLLTQLLDLPDQYHAQQAMSYIVIKPQTKRMVEELKDCISGNTVPSPIVRLVDEHLKSPFYEWYARMAAKPNRSKRFIRELAFIHRPQIAYNIFCDTANRVFNLRISTASFCLSSPPEKSRSIPHFASHHDWKNDLVWCLLGPSGYMQRS